jgi:hypothetical protein
MVCRDFRHPDALFAFGFKTNSNRELHAMKHTVITLPIVATALWSSVAWAAPISATSELEMFHRYTVNSGSVPTGLRINNLFGSLILESSATSNVDDPGASTTNIPFVQVGNPFSDPATPYIAQRIDSTTINAGTEGSQSSYDLTLTAVDDPDANPADTSIVDRTVDTTGSARASITTAPVSADALSSYDVERGYTFENESDESIAFNIVGTVTASFLASYDGLDGFARASGSLFLEFQDLVGTEINYLPIAPYLRSIEDDAPGAFVSESLVTSNGAFNGFNFTAGASAIGDGGDTDASFDATFRYLFQVQMDAGASFNLITGNNQVNGVEYTPVIAPVPVPASLPILGTALLAFAALKRRAKRAVSLGRGFVAS